MTGNNFVEIQVPATPTGTGILIGSAVATANAVAAVNPNAALNMTNSVPAPGLPSLPAIPLDRVLFDLALTAVPIPVGTQLSALGKAVGGYAKNGAALITLTSTTAVSFDFTDLTIGATQPAAGDTTFATVNALILNNIGTHDLTIAPGGSNPAAFPKFGGTSPTLTIPAGSAICLQNLAGATVDSTHKILTITPTAGGLLAVAVGGA